ncbi:MAG TPA: RNase H family protein [Terriglobales bacterium]|nr:RNase H family protein [Terriglobales bacterium]
MSADPRAIHIFTDGSCYKNPGGKSGCAAIVHYPDHLQLQDEQIVDFGCEESNSNRMELLACICALRWVRDNVPWDDVTRVQIFTDAQYVKDNLGRAREWKKNDWRNQYDEPRENADLWNQLISAHAKAGIRVDFEWNLGKKTPILKLVDKAAKAAADRGGTDVDRGYRPGTVARSMVKGAAARYKAEGQLAVIRPYRKTPMARGEEKIRFNTFSENTQTYMESCYAYVPTALISQLHRGNGYRVRFNENPRYPQILEIVGEVHLPKPKRKS